MFLIHCICLFCRPPIIRHHGPQLDFAVAEQSACDTYAKLLLPRRHGYPLWLQDPDPGSPLEYRSVGVNIGDVGVITYDGGFDFFFNICHAANDPVNWLGVPDGFVPLTLKPEDVVKRPEMHDKGTHISSAHINKVQFGEEVYGNVLYVSICSSNSYFIQLKFIWVTDRQLEIVVGSNLSAQAQQEQSWCYQKEGPVWICERKHHFLSMLHSMALNGISSSEGPSVVAFKTDLCTLSLGVIRVLLGE